MVLQCVYANANELYVCVAQNMSKIIQCGCFISFRCTECEWSWLRLNWTLHNSLEIIFSFSLAFLLRFYFYEFAQIVCFICTFLFSRREKIDFTKICISFYWSNILDISINILQRNDCYRTTSMSSDDSVSSISPKWRWSSFRQSEGILTHKKKNIFGGISQRLRESTDTFW